MVSADTSFIPDLPKGPLDVYRKQAKFDWKKLKLVFEDANWLKLKYKIWATLEKDPLFEKPEEEPTTREQKRLTAIRLRKFLGYNFYEAKGAFTERTLRMMAINEALSAIFPDVSVKQALGTFLFQNALATLGTERHRHIIEASFNKKIFSAIALTEVAHGSDAKNMKTTAVFHMNTQEFVINTPDFKAAKCWVGNLGKTSTIIILFAQLYINNECYGLHAFLVPIRDPKTLLPYPGIIVGDLGEKIGLNGIDNGFIMFQNYRIPREYLMNRAADVTPEGKYEGNFSDAGKVLGATLENLSAARIGIMLECASNLIIAITIAVRYASVRKQFGPSKDIELPIIEYPLHQWRLFPHLAAAAVVKISAASISAIYINTLEMSQGDIEIENLRDTVSETHAMISICKPLISWTSLKAIQECREACGGHGYLKAARFGELRNTVDPSVSYEGDNNVLLQQTSSWLLRQWHNIINGDRVCSPLGTCSFYKNRSELLNTEFSGAHTDDVKNFNFLFLSYHWLLVYLTKLTYAANEVLMKKYKCKFTARNNIQVYKAAVLSRVYGEYVMLTYYWKRINQPNLEAPVKEVLETAGVLYGLFCLDNHLAYFYKGGFAVHGHFCDLIRDGILELCQKLKPDAVALVDALAPPDFVTSSVLGKSDGKIYENLQAQFFNNPEALSRAPWWREISVDDAPDLRVVSKL